MSLINDALRRAKEAQADAPPPTPHHLPFRPIEPAQQKARRGLGLLLPGALAFVALLSLLFVWQWSQARMGATPTEVKARTTHVPLATTPTAASATRPAPAQAPSAPPSPAIGAAATHAADATSAPTGDPIDDMQKSEDTDLPALTAPTPPKPAPLRLQAIVFNPKRPSAMISGKTLFVGDKLGDLRVVAIDKDSATLAGAGRTNVLTLSE